MDSEWLEVSRLITLVINTAVGSAAYVGFQVNVKKQPLTLGFIFGTFFLSLFVANVISEVLILKEAESWRTVGMIVGAFLATYIIKWFDTDFMDIFRGIMNLFLKNNDKKDDYDNYR